MINRDFVIGALVAFVVIKQVNFCKEEKIKRENQQKKNHCKEDCCRYVLYKKDNCNRL